MLKLLKRREIWVVAAVIAAGVVGDASAAPARYSVKTVGDIVQLRDAKTEIGGQLIQFPSTATARKLD